MAGKVAVVTRRHGWTGRIDHHQDGRRRLSRVVTYSPSNTKYKAWLEEMKGRGYSFSRLPPVDVVDFDDCAQVRSRSRPSSAPSTPGQQRRHHARP